MSQNSHLLIVKEFYSKSLVFKTKWNRPLQIFQCMLLLLYFMMRMQLRFTYTLFHESLACASIVAQWNGESLLLTWANRPAAFLQSNWAFDFCHSQQYKNSESFLGLPDSILTSTIPLNNYFLIIIHTVETTRWKCFAIFFTASCQAGSKNFYESYTAAYKELLLLSVGTRSEESAYLKAETVNSCYLL